MKHCPKCGANKPRTEFYSAKNRPDGLYNYCKPCALTCARADYSKHRQQKRAAAREYARSEHGAATRKTWNKRHYAENRATELANAKRWTHENPERRRAYVKKWNNENRDKVREYQERYKRLKRGATEHTLTIATWRLLKTVFRDKCAYCGKPTQKPEQDHMTPLSRGGRHAHDNVVPACRHCNAVKAAGAQPAFWWVANA